MKSSGASRSKPATPASTSEHRRGLAVIYGVLLVAATLAAYYPAVRGGYIWDDPDYLTENPHVQSPEGIGKIWSFQVVRRDGRTRVEANIPQYYPLVFTTFWIEHQLWGLEPLGYHLVNVILHVLNVLLVWRLCLVLRIPAAWFVAGVFALHPMNVDSVAWVAQRKNVLSTLSALLAMLCYLRFAERGRLRSYLGAAVCTVAALLSKIVAVVLPFVILLAVFRFTGRIRRREVLGVVPLLALGIALGFLTLQIERYRGGAHLLTDRESLLERALIIAPSAFCFYAAKMAWPYPLAHVYPRWTIDASDWAAYLPLVAVLAAAGLGLVGSRRFGFGPLLVLLATGLTLAPALGFFFVAYHGYSWVANHFNYLSGLGFIILYTGVAVQLGRDLLGRRVARPAVPIGLALTVLLALGLLCFRQSRLYQDPARLWEDTLARNPDAWPAMVSLGKIFATSRRFDQAQAMFERAMAYPRAANYVYYHLGNVFVSTGRFAQAIPMYKKAIEIRPSDPTIYINLSQALVQSGRLDEAADVFASAVKLAPYANMYLNLGLLRAEQGRRAEAIQCFRRAGELVRGSAQAEQRLGASLLAGERFPESLAAYRVALEAAIHEQLGESLFLTGQYAQAVAEYYAALKTQGGRFKSVFGLVAALFHDGHYPEALKACRAALEQFHNDTQFLTLLAYMLATCPDASVRDAPAALRIAQQVVSVVGADATVLNTLALAHVAAGDLDGAARAAHAASAAAQPQGERRALARLLPNNLEVREHLGDALFERGRYAEAIAQYEAALAVDPARYVARYGLIVTLFHDGQYAQAVQRCYAALESSPEDPQLLNLLAYMLATCPDAAVRDGPQAVRIAREVVNRVGADANVLDTLALAYAEIGDFDSALHTAGSALGIARQQNDRELAGKIEHRLGLFRQGKPYRHGAP